MWILTTGDRRAVYNLSAFEVVVAEKDLTTDTWIVQAMESEGGHRVKLAETDDQEAADNIVTLIAKGLDAMDLGAE